MIMTGLFCVSLQPNYKPNSKNSTFQKKNHNTFLLLNMEYNFTNIENKWRTYWEQNETYKVNNSSSRPKYYVLDMFPYPSGSGLHVGHPLGYIASDIVSRHKRMQGYNVLHPMGFDAFGLPAEQYALEHGLHPEFATRRNIDNFKKQLRNIGFCYDWTREITTCDTDYYKHTQWIFLQLFEHWYDNSQQKAQAIAQLIAHFEQYGTHNLNAACSEYLSFTAAEWHNKNEEQRQIVLMNYRLAYSSYADIWYCPALGTVLANDEVKDGLSERGGHPVEKRKLRQWFLRTTAYAERLLSDLDTLDWSDSLKEMQRNWIGRSEGALVNFALDKANQSDQANNIAVFTTRPDTIFGVTFMVIAPEHELVAQITTDAQRNDVEEYIAYVKRRSERDRLADVKTVTGCFTGAYALNPLNQQPIPVWISEYVLAGYGTGAIMAVPSSDDRDFRFAQKFNLPIIHVIADTENLENPTDKKRGTTINSDFLNGLETEQAISAAIKRIEEIGAGKGKINYRLRDAGFSRQRYWGEPFPIVYKNNIPYPLPESELPLALPQLDDFTPTGSGKSPLSKLENWVNVNGNERETDTMPGYAGSSWYYLRYMDPHNKDRFVSPEAEQYWGNVDFYIGGIEHAVGHLLYSRTWYKFFYDKGWVSHIEPFKRLINQGMIQGRSNFVYRIKGTNTFVSAGLKDQYETTELHADVNMVQSDVLDTEAFKNWKPDYMNAEFILENGKYICGHGIEKMSKSKHNVVNPDDMVAKYGADCFRMYEMFLGPIEDSKPWSTESIPGVSRFLNKLWRLFFDAQGNIQLSDAEANEQELKILHKTIKKINEDIERFSLNTCVSAFMECVNHLGELKCNKRAILSPLVQLMAPFAPFISEELWQNILQNDSSIHHTPYPTHNEAYLIENAYEYPIQINGKVREKITISLQATQDEVLQILLTNDNINKWINGAKVKKLVYVPGRIVNLVV
jgi:leucyl-tRNA synthetase